MHCSRLPVRRSILRVQAFKPPSLYTEGMLRILRWALTAVIVALASSESLHAAAAAAPPPMVSGKLKPQDFQVEGKPAMRLLVVHYHRADENYTDWNLWAWPENGVGHAYPFTLEDSFGRMAVVPFLDFPPRVGFLVRKGEWQEKDVDQDRFIATTTSAKVMEIWLKSGDPAIALDAKSAEPEFSIVSAFLDKADTITLATTRALTKRQLHALVVSHATDAKKLWKVKSVTPIQSVGGRAMYSVTLTTRVSEFDVGALQLSLKPNDGDVAPTPATTIVYARDVLNDAVFQALDTPLSAICTTTSTQCTTWSPVSSAVDLLLFSSPDATTPDRILPLTRGAHGVWTTTITGDLHRIAYQYRYTNYGAQRDVADIHGYAATSDSKKTVFVDLSRLEPAGWSSAVPPRLAQRTDEVIYEIHVRDFSIRDLSTPSTHRGTYLGLLGGRARTATAPSTGLAHVQDLGVTAVHLLPLHDFSAKLDEYNWGYWTTLFNVPESNYASNPSDPTSAIVELRTAVDGLHRAGLRVILDVVYNHTSDASVDSPFGAIAPFYFFRTTPDGRLMNDTGVGNTLDDGRPMMRKYILDSLCFWAEQYDIDGFRFDLLGTAEVETVRAICDRLMSVRNDLTLYGEPWTGGGETRFGKGAQRGLPIAVFNDSLRNAIRGDLDGREHGFAFGKGGDRAAIRRGVAGAIDEFATEPSESVSYVSAHDNLTLWDKIAKTRPDSDEATRRSMQQLAIGVVLTSQGLAFLHGGSDFCRTKGGEHNSYNAGDDVNAFDWERKAQYQSVQDFVAGLVRLRRAHPAFRMDTDEEVRKVLAFSSLEHVVAFTLDGKSVGDAWSRIFVAYNDEPTTLELELPRGNWSVVVDDTRAGTTTLRDARGRVTLPPYSVFVAHAD